MAYLFRSERLVYRAVDLPADEDFFTSLQQDSAAYRQVWDKLPIPQNKDTANDFLKWAAEASLVMVVICISNPDPSIKPVPIGWINLWADTPTSSYRHNRNASIGTNIAEAYRSQGFGSEAIRWVVEWGFQSAGLHRIGVGAFEFNDKAVQLYDRLGFVREGVKRECIWHDGRWWDIVEMSLLEHEWRKVHEKS